MIAHPIDSTSLPDTAAILQLNCRRSPPVSHSLFNYPHTANYLILALQEPPVKTHTNSPSEHRGWYLVSHRPNDLTEASRPRSCLYINTTRETQVQPVHVTSQDLSACVVKTQDEEFLVINVYNPPKTLLGFEAMDSLLKTLSPSTLLLPTIIVTDANLHSSLWNPAEYSVHDTAADTLVEMMLSWDLYLRSPKGVPTYEAKAGMQSGVTIDLVWVNRQADDLLVACVVDTDGQNSHHSDHLALVTVIRVKRDHATAPRAGSKVDKAWHRVDQAKFLRELKALLPPLPAFTSSLDIDFLDSQLSDSITTSLNLSSPTKSHAHKHKAWWNPKVMGPLRQEADKARKFAKLHPSEDSRATYRSARNAYFRTIEQEKVNSWRKYLSTLTVDTLFQAKRYATGSRQSSLISTLIDKDGKTCESNSDKARVLFNTTCVATAHCDVDDIEPQPFPRHPLTHAKYLPSPVSYFSKASIKEALNST